MFLYERILDQNTKKNNGVRFRKTQELLQMYVPHMQREETSAEISKRPKRGRNDLRRHS